MAMRVFSTWAKTIGVLVYAVYAVWAAGALAAGAAAAPGSFEAVAPDPYRLDPVRSGVTFDVEYVLHTRLTMHIDRMRARLTGIEDGLAAARVSVTIDAASVKANMPFVARIVEGDDMLDAARYPDIRFVSTRFVRTGPSSGLLTGALTIRATTHPVTLTVTFDGTAREAGDDPPTLAFLADGHFSRAAFGLSRWPSAVGDDVHMRIRAAFVRE